MNDVIIAGDDEVDLCLTPSTDSSLSRELFLLSGLVTIVFLIVVLQQWQGSLGWNSPVAHADTASSTENICVLKNDAVKFFEDDTAKISVLVQPCLPPPETKTAQDTSQKIEPLPKNMPENAEPDKTTDVTKLKQDLSAVVAGGYPIAAMVPAIAEQDRAVAAFLVGIAKKESDWGKHVPTKNGSDCYNYWGYKGAGARGEALGYACFASKEEAVQTVGKRLWTLVNAQHRDTPAKMLVWKCGSSCTGHSAEGVQSWIGTVEKYHTQIIRSPRG